MKSLLGRYILLSVSGIGLITLILLLFPGSYIPVGFLGAAGLVLAILWIVVVCCFRKMDKFHVVSSKKLKTISISLSVFIDAVLVFFAGMVSIVFIESNSAKIVQLMPLFDKISSFINISAVTWSLVILIGIISFFALCILIHNVLGAGVVAVSRKEGAKTVGIFAIASGLWIFIPLLSIYASNIIDISVLFIILLSIFYIGFTLIIYGIALRFFKNSFTAFCICALMWIGFSVSYEIHALLSISNRNYVYVVVYAVLLLLVIFAVGLLLNKLFRKLNLDSGRISKGVLALVIALLILLAVLIGVSSLSETVTDYDSSAEIRINESFNHPNIYWIHGESMVDSTVLEKYWGDETIGFESKLNNSGFIFNHESYISGELSGVTTQALSSLFVPEYYDAVSHGDASSSDSQQVFELYNNNALINGLRAVGYDTKAIFLPSDFSYIPITPDTVVVYDDEIITTINPKNVTLADRIFYCDSGAEGDLITYSAYPLSFGLNNLIDCIATIYSQQNASEISVRISDDEKNGLFTSADWLETRGYSNLLDALASVLNESGSPRFLFIDSYLAHTPYNIDADGHVDYWSDSEGIADYYGQYLFSEKVILYYVDKIIESDEDAVIIIQGDHGPHKPSTMGETEYLDFFSPDSNIVEYRNHVLSAIRIPAKYISNESIDVLNDPHNIVRWLINSYVGPNYNYVVDFNYTEV